jgi:hypothetical protein
MAVNENKEIEGVCLLHGTPVNILRTEMKVFFSPVAYLYETSDWKNQCIEHPPAWGLLLAYVPLCWLRV